MILPSFLEYSVESLDKKIDLILANPEKFQEIIKPKTELKIENKNEEKWHFHLDFVLNQFAKDRSVMQSLGLEIVFGVLQKKMIFKDLVLTVHLMGEMEDLVKCFEFFRSFQIPKNWRIELFVPKNMTDLFSFEKENLKTFTWFDLGSWEDFTVDDLLKMKSDVNLNLTNLENSLEMNEVKIQSKIFELENCQKESENYPKLCQNYQNHNSQNQTNSTLTKNLVSKIPKDNSELELKKEIKPKVLLMTVKAGLSGQKMTLETKQKAIEVVQKNSEVNFILDGGWQLSDLTNLQNLGIKLSNVDLVSYSSFWQSF